MQTNGRKSNKKAKKLKDAAAMSLLLEEEAEGKVEPDEGVREDPTVAIDEEESL